MYAAVVFLCALAATTASIVEYQAWPAAVSHQSKVEVHPSPLHYAAPLYAAAPLVSHGYGYDGYGYDGYGYGGAYGTYGAYGYGAHGLLGAHGHHLYKRSAHYSPLVPVIAPHAVVVPAAVSHQSRVDIHQSAPYAHYAAPYAHYAAPYAYGYGAPLAYSQLYSPKAYGAYGYHW